MVGNIEQLVTKIFIYNRDASPLPEAELKAGYISEVNCQRLMQLYYWLAFGVFIEANMARSAEAFYLKDKPDTSEVS